MKLKLDENLGARGVEMSRERYVDIPLASAT